MFSILTSDLPSMASGFVGRLLYDYIDGKPKQVGELIHHVIFLLNTSNYYPTVTSYRWLKCGPEIYWCSRLKLLKLKPSQFLPILHFFNPYKKKKLIVMGLKWFKPEDFVVTHEE